MKLKPEAKEEILEQLQEARDNRGWTYAELGRRSGVEVSRVQKICEGGFISLNQNVLQICSILGVLPAEADGVSGTYERMLAAGVIALWDRSEEDAMRLLRLLNDLAEIRGPRA